MTTDIAPLTVPEARFDGWARPLPEEPWEYEVDDHGIVYGPGWWPFYRTDRPGTKPKPVAIRLAPDADYRAWRNGYVIVFPKDRETVSALLHLYVEPHGMGADVFDVEAYVNVRTGDVTYRREPPASLRGQADALAGKVARLAQTHRRLRRTSPAPLTAHGRWMRSQGGEE